MHDRTLKRPSKNGEIVVNLGWKGGFQSLQFDGGPFNSAPDEAFRIAVRAENIQPGDCEVHLPIRDFSVPEDDEAVVNAVRSAYQAAINGLPVYVGCMGGYGRTGLFLALLAKTAGVPDPVTWVRYHYHRRAVETKDQEAYVELFDVKQVRRSVLGYAWGRRIKSVFHLK